MRYVVIPHAFQPQGCGLRRQSCWKTREFLQRKFQERRVDLSLLDIHHLVSTDYLIHKYASVINQEHSRAYYTVKILIGFPRLVLWQSKSFVYSQKLKVDPSIYEELHWDQKKLYVAHDAGAKSGGDPAALDTLPMDTLQAHEVFNEHLVKGTPDRDVSPQMSSGERREQYKVASGKAVDQPSEVPQAVVPSQGPSSGTGDAHPEPEHKKPEADGNEEGL